MIRWHAERRAAMQTIMQWEKLKYEAEGDDISRKMEAELVWAGWESLEFINMFPAWNEKPGVKELNKEVNSTVHLNVCCF